MEDRTFPNANQRMKIWIYQALWEFWFRIQHSCSAFPPQLAGYYRSPPADGADCRTLLILTGISGRLRIQPRVPDVLPLTWRTPLRRTSSVLDKERGLFVPLTWEANVSACPDLSSGTVTIYLKHFACCKEKLLQVSA